MQKRSRTRRGSVRDWISTWSALDFQVHGGQCHSADEAQLFDNLELASVIYAEALKQLDKL